jgi:hypothetical protein
MKAEETEGFGAIDVSHKAQVVSDSLREDGFPRIDFVPEIVGITFAGRVYHPIYEPTGETPCGYTEDSVYHVKRWQVDGRWRPCPECFDIGALDIEIPPEDAERDLAASRSAFRNGGCPMCQSEYDSYMTHLIHECEGEP